MDQCYCRPFGFVCVCIVQYLETGIVTKIENTLPLLISTFFVLAFKTCSVLIYYGCFGEFGIGVAFDDALIFCDSSETLQLVPLTLFHLVHILNQ